MALVRVLVVLATIATVVVLPPAATATEHVVSWGLGFDYATWAAGKEFRVGDTLVFEYTKGKHNVYKVNGREFKACTVPGTAAALHSGRDVVTLLTEGKKWYICGVAGHCEKGQKLAIKVLPPPMTSSAPTSSPIPGGPRAPPPTPGGESPSPPTDVQPNSGRVAASACTAVTAAAAVAALMAVF